MSRIEFLAFLISMKTLLKNDTEELEKILDELIDEAKKKDNSKKEVE